MQKFEENVAKMENIYSLIKQLNTDTVLAKDLTDYETNLKNAFIETKKENKAQKNDIN